MTPHQIWRSGFVHRWHSNPDMSDVPDPNAAHQGRCGMLALVLWPNCSRDLLAACVTHDAAEVVVGDLAVPFKADRPDICAAHALAEETILDHMGLSVVLLPEDERRLRLIDRLDAYLFVQHRRRWLLAGDGWPEARAWLVGQAWALGVGAEVEGMV